MTPTALRRGTVVTVASPGAYSGNPRPAAVVQADRWLQAHPSVTLCPLTSTLRQAPLARFAVEPSPRHGLRKPSQLMADKLFTVPLAAVGEVWGSWSPMCWWIWIWPCGVSWSCPDPGMPASCRSRQAWPKRAPPHPHRQTRPTARRGR